VGENTAGAILTYAFNQPTPFIETNVRTVFFHHFFENREDVADKEILPLLEKAIDQEHPREFYWALMDYGTYLKKTGAGKIRISKHYKKQSVLKGSVREVRGQIVRILADADETTETLKAKLVADERFASALEGLIKDGLVQQEGSMLHLTK
jgi:A/G-specific adenine glycosylase